MIWLARHGQTEFNRAGRYQGGCDSPLTGTGVAQAHAMGATLAKLVSGERCALIASPLGRAVRTAEIIGEVAGVASPLQLDPRLAEISLGSWDGLTEEEVEDISPGACDGADRYEWFFRSPDGESYAHVVARLQSWLSDVAARDDDVIAVSHGVAGRILRGLYLGLSEYDTLHLRAPQDAVFRLADGTIDRFECAPED